MYKNNYIAVIIPCYNVDSNTTLKIIKKIPNFVDIIYVVDDACPSNTGNKITSKNLKRVKVVFNKKNIGVGGSIIKIYKKFKKKNAYLIKIDGDGQMSPKYIVSILNKIISKNLDYIKGNRFKNIKILFEQMPLQRIFGNFILSYFSMLSSGYNNVFDCTNGYTCIKTKIIKDLPLEKIHKRFFFETDILFYLFRKNAKVEDFYMNALYGDEQSNLSLIKIIPQFLYFLSKNYIKRVFR
jgi:dolichol-phosphate mannosyltransferase